MPFEFACQNSIGQIAVAVQNTPAQNNMLTAWSPNDARSENREVLKTLVLKIDWKKRPACIFIGRLQQVGPIILRHAVSPFPLLNANCFVYKTSIIGKLKG